MAYGTSKISDNKLTPIRDVEEHNVPPSGPDQAHNQYDEAATSDRGSAIDSLNIIELDSKEIATSFGREEDYIELHIYNVAGQKLYSEPNFTDYTTDITSNKITAINLDSEEILKTRGYTSGRYLVRILILRNKIFNSTYFPFRVKDISTTRREIKSVAPDVTNLLFDKEVESFILEIEGSSYFKEFSLNFGEGNLFSGINLLLNKGSLKHELILKTLDPLPTTIQLQSEFKVVEEITDPVQFAVDLGDPELTDDSINLRGPNFQINTVQKSSIPSALKSYDEILTYNVTSSYNRLLNKLENPDTINIQYDYIRNVSESMDDYDIPYHFENFIHFSSAEERLKNFHYKMKLLESYDSTLAETQLVPGDSTGYKSLTVFKEGIKTKKQDLIKGFDGYEQFLYYTTGSNPYTWPKTNSSSPFNPYSITSSTAINWLGDASGTTLNYTGQLLSASLYDRKNEYNLNKLIPAHIVENSDNSLYISFVNMIGQHFDHIWTHIKHLTEVNNLDNKFGISKELVYYQLKSLGIDTFDQYENSNIIEYILGEGLQDNTVGGLVVGEYIVGGLSKNFYNTPVGTKTYVTSSNEGSVPKRDITREIWKRLYNNSPYLLKTKGTERGLRALMSCYGIPSTILNVKEYGGNTPVKGPLKDLDTSDIYKTFSYDKSGLSLKGEADTTKYFISTKWSSSATDALEASAKTVEFRIKPDRISSNQHLFTLSGSDATKDPHLILTNYTSITDISSSNDATQHGRIDLYINGSSVANTNNFPIFNGDFWNVFIGVSGSHNTAADIKFGAYQSNWLKHVSYYTASYNQSVADRQLTFGDPTYGGNNLGGGSTVYFGGTIDNAASAYNNIDGLKYSGSLQEIKIHFGELLSHETLKKHALEPFMYAGNTPSSSYEHVVLRLPLGSNDIKDSGSYHPNIDTNYLEYSGIEGSQIGNGFIIEAYHRKVSSSMTSQEWKEVIETHHLPTPDTVGSSMTSEKVRIDQGNIPSDNILLTKRKREISTLDRQPLDFPDLGVYFSPTNEINEDIIYTLGSFRLDDYIGNPLPSAQSSSIYEDLKDIKNTYFKKVKSKYNYWEYIKTIQNFDHTLFKIIEQFTPAKANLKTGLLIEPNFLERPKIAREMPVRSDGQTMITGSHQTFEVQIVTEYEENKIYSFATSSQQTKTGFGCDKFPTAPGCPSSSIGRWEPGTYVISNNNLTNITSSKTSERLEQGTNATIELYDEYMDPVRNKKNTFKALHAFNGQSCQAPIKPFVQRVSGIGGNNYGIGAAAIEVSFVIEDYYSNGGGTIAGIGYSAIESGFMVEGYLPTGFTGIGNATIGSTFVVGSYTVLPVLNSHYKTHKSNTFLGNATVGRKSKKYFKYQTHAFRSTTYSLDNPTFGVGENLTTGNLIIG